MRYKVLSGAERCGAVQGFIVSWPTVFSFEVACSLTFIIAQ